MRNTTVLTYFDRELTGCLIEKEIKTIKENSPSRGKDSFWETVFFGLARVVDISNLKVDLEMHTSQKKESYCIYVDRGFVGIIAENMRVRFNPNFLGENLPFESDLSENIVTGYIKRAVSPQARSRIGKLELYITTNN